MKEKPVLGTVLEGESYVGKSTTLETVSALKEMREQGIIIIPEYSVIGRLPNFPRETVTDIKKATQKMIELEKRRTDKLVDDIAHHSTQWVLFDRGPVSCIAFEHAAEKFGYKGAALWIAEAFQREILEKNIIVPAGMLHLTAVPEVIEQREMDHIHKGHGRILEFLRERGVRKALNDAFHAFGKFLPEQLFFSLDTGNKNPREVSAEVLQFITNQSIYVEDHIPDFVAYAHSLVGTQKKKSLKVVADPFK